MAKQTKKQQVVGKIDREKLYSWDEAIAMLREHKAKFDETVEVAMNLGVDPRHADQMVRGMVSLPGGTGKDVRVAVFAAGVAAAAARAAGADHVGADDLSGGRRTPGDGDPRWRTPEHRLSLRARRAGLGVPGFGAGTGFAPALAAAPMDGQDARRRHGAPPRAELAGAFRERRLGRGGRADLRRWQSLQTAGAD